MREELQPIIAAIKRRELPNSLDELFRDAFDYQKMRFLLQETYVLDYKDNPPSGFTDAYGSSIIRLALAMHNTYGGIIVFGVTDRSLQVCGCKDSLDIEAVNSVIKEKTGVGLECLAKAYETEAGSIHILLVPQRGFQRPVYLRSNLGGYKAGEGWVRIRHEAKRLTSEHLPFLYTARNHDLSDDQEGGQLAIHRSIPASPSTMHSFVDRNDLMARLWDWFVFSDQPRMYIAGPGGSGKSTLAFEFAHRLAASGLNVLDASGRPTDYVLFLSAKETELNSLTGKTQDFVNRDFSDQRSQIRQILAQSGQLKEEMSIDLDEDSLVLHLQELFDQFNGLIVLDDIDALSRRGVDTGEETLFMRAMSAKRKAKILYTLRYPPPYARKSTIEVPGLNDDEFFSFIETCCSQFDTQVPPPDILPVVQEETSSLPLLIETVVGLRRSTGNYRAAVAHFKEKGGDYARRYLYQREYDVLSKDGKSREVMAALSLLDEPVSFVTLYSMLGLNPTIVTDAISECMSIFLSQRLDSSGETLYQLASPAVPFVRSLSARLSSYSVIQRKVEYFRKQGLSSTPEEAAIITRLTRLLDDRKYDEVCLFADSMPLTDSMRGNGKILSLLGRGYANSESKYWEKARECFRAAEALNHMDIPMMRAWYHLEFSSGYGVEEAQRVCQVVLAKHRTGRQRSEFLSKLGNCLQTKAKNLISVSLEKSVPLLVESTLCYIEAFEHGDMDSSVTAEWLSRPLGQIGVICNSDLAVYLSIIDIAVLRRISFTYTASETYLRSLRRSIHYLDPSQSRRNAALLKKAVGVVDRESEKANASEGWDLLFRGLDQIRSQFDR